jgi:hypothetical protein
MSEIKYSIDKEIGIVSGEDSLWHLELNKVSWNGQKAKYDLRRWTDGHQKMSKGITLSEDELLALRDFLNEMEE